MLWIWLYVFIFAMECRRDELAAELEKVDADLTACEGERVEGIEVDM